MSRTEHPTDGARDESGTPSPKSSGTVESTAPSGFRNRRVRREDPERVYPDRSPSGVFRRGTATSRAASSEEGYRGEKSGKGPFGTIERGVREGYRVIEEYLREGQRVAQQINRRQYGPRQMGDDLQALTGRMFRDSTRLLTLWLDLMSSSVETFWGGGRSVGLGKSDRGRGATARTTAASPEPGPAGVAQETAVTVEVASSHPARVTVYLSPGAAERPLRPTPLAGDPETPPLTAVTFEPGSRSEAPALRLEVPTDQPPGVYHGVLVDPASHEHRGTVRVDLRAPTKQAGASKKESRRSKKNAAKKPSTKKPSTKKAASRRRSKTSGSSTSDKEKA
jgi:hypothetical protein